MYGIQMAYMFGDNHLTVVGYFSFRPVIQASYDPETIHVEESQERCGE